MFSIKRVVIPSRNQNMAMENALPSYNDVPCHIYKQLPIAAFESEGVHCHWGIFSYPQNGFFTGEIFMFFFSMFFSRALLPGLCKACPAAQAAGSQGGRTTRHQPQQSFFHQGALDVTKVFSGIFADFPCSGFIFMG